jgi:hypothetical protein
MKPNDVERIMDAISNLHERHRPTEKASPHNRQRLHAYTNNITAPGDVGTTMNVIGNGSYGLRQ